MDLSSIHNRLKTDLHYFSAKAYKIKDKAGKIVPFRFNKTQVYTHAMFQDQLKRTGMVRANIIKARQTGESTYVAARYQHACQFKPGTSVFILTHRDDATQNLYRMVKRYRDNLPEALKPKMEKDTQDKAIYCNGSDYSLGTAASPDVGRSMTVQKFHGSEVAFWKYSDDIQTGVLQTIADVPGTEVIFESTAKGPMGMFHDGVMDVMQGRNKRFMNVFIPWFWTDEYREKLEPGEKIVYDDEEAVLVEAYGLDDEQVKWRRWKIIDLKSAWKFKQEYPSNIIEAFQTTSDGLFNAERVLLDRNSDIKDLQARVVIGFDPGRKGDKSVWSFRRGREMFKLVKEKDRSETLNLGRCMHYLDMYPEAVLFLDVAHGYSIYDHATTLGYKNRIVLVHFNEQADDTDRFINRRAEMLFKVKDWVEGGGVSLVDDDELYADFLAIPSEEYTTNNKIQIMSKKQIKKELGRSPDTLDSLMLTFAHNVTNVGFKSQIKKAIITSKIGTSPLTTLNRHRKVQKKDNKISIFGTFQEN